MIKLDVILDARSYPIQIGTGVLRHMEWLLPCLREKRIFVVTNTTVAPLYLPQLETALTEQDIAFHSVVLPDGEQFKNWVTLNTIYDEMLKYRCERSTLLLALGGGVIGDMAGFAAATYQRGMPFVQLPTTLLAQVDSSVGGKTAINHPLGKNMIGAFYQPCAVLADIATLRTLPQRELSAGMAEVIKYGLIHDRPFFEWLEQHMEALLARDEILLAQAVHRSCAIKARIVAADETEQGARALLNLGHTFGHAIETGLGYGEWLHGEAVAAGTMMAVELSARLGLLPQDAVGRIEALFARADLPVNGPDLAAEEYLRLMANDKKVLHGRPRLVLLRAIGEAVLFSDASQVQIVTAIQARTC